MKIKITPDQLSNNCFEATNPCVISGFPSGTVIDRIEIQCGREPDAAYMLRIDDSNIRINRLILSGIADPVKGIEAWKRQAAGGVLVTGQNVEIGVLDAENVHTAATLRGRSGCIGRASVRGFSGDGININANDCMIGRDGLMQFTDSFSAYDWSEFHKDIIQLWAIDDAELKNVLIKNVRYNGNNNSLFMLGGPSELSQGIGGFDGTYRNIVIQDCELLGVHDEHGISFGHAIDCRVENCKTDSLIRFGDRKTTKKGRGNRVIDCQAKAISFEDDSEFNNQPAQQQRIAPITSSNDDSQQPVSEKTDAWLSTLKNTKAPALTPDDFEAAAERSNIESSLIKTTFTIEAGASGFNADGSLKSLYERHLLHAEVKERGLDLKAISRVLGSELISYWRGGYKGGIAEYWRLQQVIRGLAQFMPIDDAIEIALRCTSWGRPQILGKNCELAGYSTATEMVIAMHANEKAHLDAFISFIEKSGLDKPLREKDFTAFAKGYNGKSCCEKGSKRDYSALLAAEYRRISGNTEPLKPLNKSRTVQGTATGIAASGAGLGAIASEVKGYIDGVTEKLQGTQEQINSITDSVTGIKDQVSSLAIQNSDLLGMVTSMKGWIYVLGIALAISMVANGYALYARWDDRRNGYR